MVDIFDADYFIKQSLSATIDAEVKQEANQEVDVSLAKEGKLKICKKKVRF